MSPEEPPFETGISHIDLTETHRLHDQLKDQWDPNWETEREEIVDSLRNLIKGNSVRRTLTQLATQVYFTQFVLGERGDSRRSPGPRDIEMTAEDDPGLSPRLREFATGIALTVDSPDGGDKLPLKALAHPLLKLMIWHGRMGKLHEMRTTTAEEHITQQGVHSLAFRELTMLRHADGRQMLEKAYRFYKPWEEQLEQMLGFGIEDAIYYHNLIAEHMAETIPDVVEESIQYTDSLLCFGDSVLSKMENALWYTREELVDICDDSNRFHAFLDSVTATQQKVRDYNLPTDVNPLHIEPIPKVDGEYMVPLPRTMQVALANVYYYDLINSPYQGEFGDSIGRALEEWAADCLERVLSPDNIHGNVEYVTNGETTEADLLVKHDGTVLVIECKGKRLTAPTRQGQFGGERGFEAIQKDVDASIGDATRQAERLASRIESGEIKTVRTSDGETLDVSDSDACYRCVVLSESFGQVATRDFAGMLDLETIPYVCDIYDFEVITEVLNDPAALIRYIKDRVRMTKVQTYYIVRRVTPTLGQYSNQATFSPDEIDYLGVYHRNGNQFPPGAKYIVGAGDRLREEAINGLVERNAMRVLY